MIAQKALRLATAAAVLPLAATPLQAAAPGSTIDPRVRAAAILNIIRFVDFGGLDSRAPMQLCVRRGAPAARAIVTLDGERVGMHRVTTREIAPGKVEVCDIVYVGQVTGSNLAGMRQPGVLLIGDGSDFIDAGGTIGLIASAGQIRFEANPGAARAAGLRLSSKLLRLATRLR